MDMGKSIEKAFIKKLIHLNKCKQDQIHFTITVFERKLKDLQEIFFYNVSFKKNQLFQVNLFLLFQDDDTAMHADFDFVSFLMYLKEIFIGSWILFLNDP